jgi:hypothetical protein
MPMTNPRQIAAWQDRFNRPVREIVGPALADRGYRVSLDQVVEEVEPDSYGPFYVGEVGFTKPLPNGRFAHVVIQSTRQSLRPSADAPDSFYVDLLRTAAADPPSWAATGSARAEATLRVPRQETETDGPAPLPTPPPGGDQILPAHGPRGTIPRVRSQQGWEFRSEDDLRAELHHLIARLIPGAGHSVLPGGGPLDRIEQPGVG